MQLFYNFSSTRCIDRYDFMLLSVKSHIANKEIYSIELVRQVINVCSHFIYKSAIACNGSCQ